MMNEMDNKTRQITCGESVKAAMKLVMVVLLEVGVVFASSAAASEGPQAQNEKSGGLTSG